MPSTGRAATVILAALGRELHRIREQVQHHLLELALVGVDLRHGRVERAIQRQAMARGALLDQGERVVDRHRHAEVRDVELHATSLDLGEIEDVVDEREQVAAGGVDVVDVLALLLVQLSDHALMQDLRESDDGV
jgi:hypothetical protein